MRFDVAHEIQVAVFVQFSRLSILSVALVDLRPDENAVRGQVVDEIMGQHSIRRIGRQHVSPQHPPAEGGRRSGQQHVTGFEAQRPQGNEDKHIKQGRRFEIEGCRLPVGDVDGVRVFPGERILVAKQDQAHENGIYVLRENLTLQRAPDLSRVNQVCEGNTVYVNRGKTHQGATYVLRRPQMLSEARADQAVNTAPLISGSGSGKKFSALKS